MFRWTKNSHTILAGSHANYRITNFEDESSVLTIPKVSASDNGINFTCVSHNDVSSDSQSTILVVKCKYPFEIYVRFQRMGGAVISFISHLLFCYLLVKYCHYLFRCRPIGFQNEFVCIFIVQEIGRAHV